MSIRLKVFVGCFDGKHRLIVACHTQTEAAALFGVSVYTMRNYGGVTSNKQEVAFATEYPGIVWKKRISDVTESWIMVENNIKPFNISLTGIQVVDESVRQSMEQAARAPGQDKHLVECLP